MHPETWKTGYERRAPIQGFLTEEEPSRGSLDQDNGFVRFMRRACFAPLEEDEFLNLNIF